MVAPLALVWSPQIDIEAHVLARVVIPTMIRPTIRLQYESIEHAINLPVTVASIEDAGHNFMRRC